MPDEVLESLEMAPFKWEDTKKITLNAREMLGPLQALQQEKVKEEVDDFRMRVAEFADDFAREAPFEFATGSEEAYRLLSEWNARLIEIEEEARKLSEDQELFELAASNWSASPLRHTCAT